MQQLMKTYRYSVIDGSLYNMMVGAGETYLPAFILAFGFSQISAGMIVVVPMVVGSTIQFALMRVLPQFKSRQKMVVTLARLQALALAVISWLAFSGHFRLRFLFVVASVYWAAGLSAGPLWNAWMGSMIPKEKSVEFFSKRSRTCQFFLVVGLVAAGLWLESFKDPEIKRLAFGWLFFAASLCRFLSAEALKRQGADTGAIPNEPLKMREAFGWFFRRDNFSFIMFLFSVQVVAQIAAPFFSPYMLKILNLDYDHYMFLLAVALLARMLVYYVYPFFSNRMPISVVGLLGYAGVIGLPLCWTFTTSYSWIILFQIGSGFFWGMYELSNFLMLFNTRSHLDRSRILTTVNFFNSIGMIIGAIVGAHTLKMGLSSKEAYDQVFTLSTVLRLLPLLLIGQFFKRPVTFRRLFFRSVGVRPNTGGITKPILYLGEDEDEGGMPPKN